jgi:hypothetical protein
MKLDTVVLGTVHFGDVVFDEQGQWDWGTDGDNGESGGGDDVFTLEYTTIGQAAPETEGADEEPAEQSTLPAMNDDTEVDNDIDDDNLDANHDDDDNLDADHDDNTPFRFRDINDIVETTGFVPRALVAEELHVVNSDELTSFTEAERNPSWRKVMMEEMTSIKENNTWSLVDLPPGRKPIGVKWVFKVKWDEHGAVSKHKTCLVVKGSTQRHGIDYDEVFMPVARLDLVRLLIALAVHEGWKVHHMDVKSTFLNGDLQEEVYVEQPAGFIVAGKEHKCSN